MSDFLSIAKKNLSKTMIKSLILSGIFGVFHFTLLQNAQKPSQKSGLKLIFTVQDPTTYV